MKITTTFWSEEVHEFSTLLYIHGNTDEVIFETELNNPFASYEFFKQISQFNQTREIHKTLDEPYAKKQYYQFAVIHKNKICPIKWFDLVINESVVISHDIAFETTLIKRNDVIIPFGKFPMSYWQKGINLPKNREFNIKSRAYQFMANQVNKNLIKGKQNGYS